MKRTIISLISSMILASALVACDNTPAKKTFSASEVLSSNFSLVPVTELGFTLNYLSGAPDQITATAAQLMTDTSSLNKIRLDYNNATQVVTFTVLDAMNMPYTTLSFPNYLLTASLKNGSEVPFTDILTDIVALHGEIDISPIYVQVIGSCEARTKTIMTLDVTADSMVFDLRASKEWVDVATGGMVTNCRVALNDEKTKVEGVDPTADYILDLLNTAGLINTSRIPQLVSYNYGYVLESTTAPSASESASNELGTPAYDLETVYSQDGIVLETRSGSLF